MAAGDGANAGAVYVEVLPGNGFWEKFVAQNRAQASKVGDDLGNIIGKSIQERIAKGVTDGLGKTPREPAARSGEAAGGAFADAFKRRVEAALKSLPDVKIGADSSEADRAIAGIRARLDELRSKKVGVDIGAAEAVAELDRLRAKLDEIGSRHANAQVRVDTAGASAELAAFQAEVDRVDGRRAVVDVDTSSATSSVSNLVAAGIGLGPALVPGAAAGAAAIAAIIPVAAGAAGAVAAIGLGLIGPIAAIKAMSAAEDQSTQSGASLASRQLQIASASDAVRSAQASLGNTLANVADQQRRSAEQVANAQQALGDARINADRANRAAVQAEADAETALTRAQRDALAAQKDLTAAREDAKRAAEDLANQVVDNAFAQQRAVLAVHDAEQQLQAVRANPQATARQRAEAQLTFDEARQHLLELGQQQQRLGEDKAKSDQAGVDGSKQVVAAQTRVTDSQAQVQAAERAVAKAREDAANTARVGAESVAKAQQALADSQAAQASQARQAAFSVAQAQQAVINAQRQLESATVGAATAGGAAMEKLQQAMDNLSPAGQRFATFLYGLKPVLFDLRHAAEEGFLPGLQAGITTMLPTLPRLTGQIRALSTEAGHLAEEAGKAFASPYWASFSDLLVSKGIPALDTAARVAYNLALGVAGLVRAALPLGAGFGEGLLSFSQRFALAANILEHTQGYREFLDYVRVQGPVVARTIGEVVQAAVRLVEAISPIGGYSLTVIRLLAETINALPVPVLTALVAGIVTVVTASKGIDLVRNVFFSAFGVGFVQMMTNAKIAMVTAAEQGAGKLAASAAGVRGAFGTLASTLGAGGLLSLGLGVAVVGAGLFAQKAAEQRARVDDLTRALGLLGEAYKRTHNLSDQSIKDVISHNDRLSDLVRNNDAYGVSVDLVARAAGGERAAQHDVIAALDAKKTAVEADLVGQSGRTHASVKQALADSYQIRSIGELRTALQAKFGELNRTADVNSKLDAAQRASTASEKAQTAAAQDGTGAFGALATALTKVNDTTASAADKANALRAADEAVFGAARNSIIAQQDQAAAEDALAAAGKRNAEQHIFGKDTLTLHTEAGRANRQMLEDRFSALGQEFLADVQSGVALDAATTKHDTNRDAIIQAAKAAGLDSDEVDRLAKTFGTLPTDPKVTVTVTGVREAFTQLETLEIAQFALKNGLDPEQAAIDFREAKGRNQAINHADGGPIFGPGGPTDDLIPAIGPGGIRHRLSNGEHVLTAAEVKAAGGHNAILALRQWLLASAGQPRALYPGDGSAGLAFAGGGAVTWPIPVTARNTRIPSLAEVTRAVTFGPDWSGPVSASLERAAAFVRAQVGKPYIWASAGPEGYDCSGLLSAAYLVAHNQSPYSHIFSTMNEAPYFPKSGYGAFSAGWTNPGERGPGGDSVGHTAGKIGNMPFESVGGLGVRIGSNVTPIGRFAHVGHYDSGGPLPPGLTIARNDTGKTEWVFTDDQVRALGGSGGGTVNHWNVYGQTGQSPAEVAHAVMHEWAWANS